MRKLPKNADRSLPPLYDRSGDKWMPVTADGAMLEDSDGERYSRRYVEDKFGPLTSTSDRLLVPGSTWGAKEGKWKGERFMFLRVERGMWVGRSLTDGTEIEVELGVAKQYLAPER